MLNRCVTLFLILSLLVIPFFDSHAGVVSDWLGATQSTTTSPGYFQGQQRDYFTGGGFNMRVPNQSFYPVSISLPHVKAGCGGIDAFMGGFNFLNFHYLVSLAQNVLQSAPYVAFDLALAILSQQGSSTVNKAIALANQLNHLQLSSCSASKYMVAEIAKGVGDISGSDKLQDDIADWAQQNGANNFYKGIEDTWKSSGNQANSIAPLFGMGQTPLLQGCNADLQQIIGTDGSFMDNVQNYAQNYGYVSLDYDTIKLVRGLVGDVNLTLNKNSNAVLVAPCNQDPNYNVSDLANGNYQIMDSSFNCHDGAAASDIGYSNGLVGYFTAQMYAMINSMESRQPLTSDQKTLVDNSPVPIYKILNAARLTNQKDYFIALSATPMAEGYAARLISDVMSNVAHVIHRVHEVAQQQAHAGGASPSSSPSNCSKVLVQNALLALDAYSVVLDKALQQINKQTAQSVQESNQVLLFAQAMQNYEKTGNDKMMQIVGDPLRGVKR